MTQLDFDADELNLLAMALAWYSGSIVGDEEYDRWLRLSARIVGARARTTREPESPAP